MPPKNIKLTIQYDGAGFHGWQKQQGVRTAQGDLEKAIEIIFGTPAATQGASRTDAGVHALGQTANFLLEKEFDTDKISGALNSKLDEDIRVTEAAQETRDFNSRFDAKGKIYQYFILNTPQPRPVLRGYALYFNKELDVNSMTEAARAISGERDYACFGSKTEKDENTFCNVEHVKIDTPPSPFHEGKLIRIEVRGDRFLYKMVRTIAGTLVEAGKGNLLPEEISDIIESRERRNAGPTLKPHGLFLVKVLY